MLLFFRRIFPVARFPSLLETSRSSDTSHLVPFIYRVAEGLSCYAFRSPERPDLRLCLSIVPGLAAYLWQCVTSSDRARLLFSGLGQDPALALVLLDQSCIQQPDKSAMHFGFQRPSRRRDKTAAFRHV